MNSCIRMQSGRFRVSDDSASMFLSKKTAGIVKRDTVDVDTPDNKNHLLPRLYCSVMKKE